MYFILFFHYLTLVSFACFVAVSLLSYCVYQVYSTTYLSVWNKERTPWFNENGDKTYYRRELYLLYLYTTVHRP